MAWESGSVDDHAAYAETGCGAHLQNIAENLLRAALGEAALLGLGDGRTKGRDDDDCTVGRVRHGRSLVSCAARRIGRKRRLLTIVVVLGSDVLLSLGDVCHFDCSRKGVGCE